MRFCIHALHLPVISVMTIGSSYAIAVYMAKESRQTTDFGTICSKLYLHLSITIYVFEVVKSPHSH